MSAILNYAGILVKVDYIVLLAMFIVLPRTFGEKGGALSGTHLWQSCPQVAYQILLLKDVKDAVWKETALEEQMALQRNVSSNIR